MKTIGLLVLIVLCIGTIRGFSQRCLPRQWGLEINGGWGDGYPLLKQRNLNYTIGVNYFRYVQNQNKWFTGIEYMEKIFCYKCTVVPLSQFLLMGGYSYNLSCNRVKSLFLNVIGTMLAGYESINWGGKDFCDGAKLLNTNSLIVGGNIGIELESYVTNCFLISLRAREKILFNSMKTLNFQYTISLKFIIK